MAATRLHRALLANGHDSKFLFFECKESDTIFKFQKRSLVGHMLWRAVKKFEIPLSMTELRIRKHQAHFETFSFAASAYTQLHEHPLVKEADVINLHWVVNFVDYRSFFINIGKPVVWTLHDMNPFQGGFHYKEDEVRGRQFLADLDDEQYRIKKDGLEALPDESMTIVAPSKWMTDLSRKSNILGRFTHHHIPYSLDSSIFKVLDKQQCKDWLGLPKDKTAVLFVSELLNNCRKGFDLVLELVKDKVVQAKCVFIAVGEVKQADQIPEIKYIGSVSSEAEMSRIYNAADLFIIPSREDNLPNTIIESLCCGTPVVGFSIGGLKESIINYENGMLADTISVPSLKNALTNAIDYLSGYDNAAISADAHNNYSRKKQVAAYLDIYNKSLCAMNITQVREGMQ